MTFKLTDKKLKLLNMGEFTSLSALFSELVKNIIKDMRTMSVTPEELFSLYLVECGNDLFEFKEIEIFNTVLYAMYYLESDVIFMLFDFNNYIL